MRVAFGCLMVVAFLKVGYAAHVRYVDGVAEAPKYTLGSTPIWTEAEKEAILYEQSLRQGTTIPVTIQESDFTLVAPLPSSDFQKDMKRIEKMQSNIISWQAIVDRSTSSVVDDAYNSQIAEEIARMSSILSKY